MGKRIFIVVFAIFLLAGEGFSQKVVFTARADGKQVLENGMFSVEYQIQNADPDNFTPPDFSPFKAAGPPSTQSSMQIINGAMKKSKTYSYRLFASKLGKFTIPPARVKVGSSIFKSNPVSVEVVAAKEKVTGEKGDVFVEIKVNHEEAFLGQQIIVDYVIYTKENVRSFKIINESEYTGFFATSMNIRSSAQREIINGEEYYTKVMERRILFPQQTGTYSIGPSNVEIGMVDPDAPQRGFIFSSRLKRSVVITNEVTIRVRDLPLSTDPAFSNAVGKYTMSSDSKNQSVTTDDAITINVEVRGDGDAKFVTPPNFIDENIFDVYDPNITLDENYNEGGKILHRKKFEYLIVPKKAGNYTIQPKFQYFNVDSMDYVTLQVTPKRIIVTQGVGNKDAALLEEDQKIVLRPIRTSTQFEKTGSGFFKSMPYWMILGFGFLSMFITGGLYYKKQTAPEVDPAELRRQQADRLAEEKLAEAQKFLASNESSKFHEEIIRAVKEYISDKYNIPATYLKKESIRSSLADRQVAEPTIDALEALINTCELNLYAGGSDASMNNTFAEAKEIIASLV